MGRQERVWELVTFVDGNKNHIHQAHTGSESSSRIFFRVENNIFNYLSFTFHRDNIYYVNKAYIDGIRHLKLLCYDYY